MNGTSGSEQVRPANGTGSATSAGTQGQRKLAVFTIVEINDEKALWRRVGNAFQNRDGSYNLLLEALPVNGKLHMREQDSATSFYGGDRT